MYLLPSLRKYITIQTPSLLKFTIIVRGRNSIFYGIGTLSDIQQEGTERKLDVRRKAIAVYRWDDIPL